MSNIIPFARKPEADPEPDPFAAFERMLPDPAEGRGRTLFVLILFLGSLVLGSLWMIDKLRDVSHIQDCVMQGRKNCAPIDVPARL
jgi:hypothetical protein